MSIDIYARISVVSLFCFQALYGFLFVVTCDGEVFYAARTVEQYLGFHQVNTPSLQACAADDSGWIRQSYV